MQRLVLLDRDGTINAEKKYLSSPDQLELLPWAAEGIQMMKRLGLATVVVTNQSGIGRGYFDFDRLDGINRQLAHLLATRGASLDRFYVCPHHPEDACKCRKPLPGLAMKAADEFGAALTESFVVGDNECDIEMGKRVGATTILVRTGYGAEVAEQSSTQPHYVVDNLLEAAQVIQRLLGEGRVAGEPHQ
jgi:D-glycero-D-manno-heptose 1,7-bisphosphate phosphatase